MPFRRHRFGASRTSGSVPKVRKVRQPKVKAPKWKDLKAAYLRYVAGDEDVRVQALYEAINWWDAAILYFLSKKPMDSTQLSTYEKANKARALGLQGTTVGEKEAGMVMALKMYEKLWGEAGKSPTIATYVEKLDAVKAELTAKANALQERFTTVIDTLSSAFTPLGIKFAVQNTDVQRQYDGNGTITLSRTLAKALIARMRTNGVLSVLFSEAPMVLNVLSIETDPDGRLVQNMTRLRTQLPTLLESILQYCQAVPRGRLFRSAPDTLEAKPEEIAAKKPRQPRPQRQPGAGKQATGPMVGGRYRAGSAMAMLYERLCDQKPRSLADVLAGIPAGNPLDRLKWLEKHGKETGKWTVTIDKSTASMTLH